MRLALRTALLLVVVSLAFPAGAPAGQRIIGGTNASPGDFPYQVLVRVSTPLGTALCGGSILSTTRVATAAHCVVDTDTGTYPFIRAPATVTVLYGGVDRPEGDPGDMSSKGVSRVQVDRRYLRRAGGEEYDTAVLTLAVPALTFNANTAPIPLATAAEVNAAFSAPPADRPIVSGWGVTNPNNPSSDSDELRFTRVPLRSDNGCSNVYGPSAFVPGVMLCAGGTPTGEDTCQGDSGGPLAIDTAGANPASLKLGGITSFGANPCGQPNVPGVYTEVTEAPTRAFLATPSAVNPPAPTGFPSVTGNLRVGEVVTCNPPALPGAVVNQHFWYLVGSSTGFVLSATTSSITLPSVALGLRVFCDARYESAGGFAFVATPLANAVGPVGAATSPTPPDTVRPKARIRRIKCDARRRCTITVVATDPDGIVKKVSATLRFKRGSKRKKKAVKLRKKRGGVYTRKVRLRKGRYKLSVVARDAAGNKSKTATKRFRVR